MPAGKGTYGSKRGRPPAGKKKAKGTISPKLAKLPPKVAAAITKNMKKKKAKGAISPKLAKLPPKVAAAITKNMNKKKKK